MPENIDKRTAKRKIGDIGEDIAERFLVKQGFTIVSRNFLRKCGEIDIICKKSEKLFFIEVKTVSRETESKLIDEYRPEDNIHPGKLKKMERTISLYLAESEFDGDWEISFVTVELIESTRTAKVRFLRDFAL